VSASPAPPRIKPKTKPEQTLSVPFVFRNCLNFSERVNGAETMTVLPRIKTGYSNRPDTSLRVQFQKVPYDEPMGGMSTAFGVFSSILAAWNRAVASARFNAA
jgi:hypothetical protein